LYSSARESFTNDAIIVTCWRFEVGTLRKQLRITCATPHVDRIKIIVAGGDVCRWEAAGDERWQRVVERLE
jgi:hypothetical protein